MESICEYTDKGRVKSCRVFNSVDNPESAYLIGYLACDGGYINARYPFMMVSGTNEHIMCSFRDRYCPDRVVYSVGKKSSEKVKATHDVYELRFPAKMNNTFKKFGIFDYKVNRRIVGIKKEYMIPYIAGCIDSDGFITVGHRKDCRSPRLRWFITHQSEMFLSDLQNILIQHDVPTTLRQHGPNVWRLQAQNTEKNKVFLNKLVSHLKDVRKNTMTNNYLSKYFVPQASDELLGSLIDNQQPSHIEVEGSETR